MKKLKYLIILLLIASNICFAQSNQIDLLLQKVNQAKDTKEKQKLIKELKSELAKENKKAQEEANAILKAKEKLPTKGFKEPSINN